MAGSLHLMNEILLGMEQVAIPRLCPGNTHKVEPACSLVEQKLAPVATHLTGSQKCPHCMSILMQIEV